MKTSNTENSEAMLEQALEARAQHIILRKIEKAYDLLEQALEARAQHIILRKIEKAYDLLEQALEARAQQIILRKIEKAYDLLEQALDLINAAQEAHNSLTIGVTGSKAAARYNEVREDLATLRKSTESAFDAAAAARRRISAESAFDDATAIMTAAQMEEVQAQKAKLH